jgi:hypothetical protein
MTLYDPFCSKPLPEWSNTNFRSGPAGRPHPSASLVRDLGDVQRTMGETLPEIHTGVVAPISIPSPENSIVIVRMRVNAQHIRLVSTPLFQATTGPGHFERRISSGLFGVWGLFLLAATTNRRSDVRYILPAILAGTMLLLLGLVRAEAQEPVCGEWVKIRDALKEKAGMVEVAGGIINEQTVVVILANPDGKWASFALDPGGLACLGAKGEGWFQYRVPGKGERSA